MQFVNQNIKENIIKLYVMKKETRQFYMFEFNISNNKKFNNLNSLNLENTKDIDNYYNTELWALKIFNTEKVEEPAIMASRASAIELNKAYAYKTVVCRTYMTYGRYYEHFMDLKMFIQISNWGSSDSNRNVSFQVIGGKFCLYDGSQYRTLLTDYSFMELKNCTGKIYIENRNLSYNSRDRLTMLTKLQCTHYSAGGLTISPGLWIGVPYTPLGASITWQKYSSYVTGYTFDTSNNVAGAKITYDGYLAYNGDQMSLLFNYSRLGTAKISNILYATLYFDMYTYNTKRGSDLITTYVSYY